MKAGLLQRLKPKSKFMRSVSILAGGTASAQLLMVVASPFLTRLYTPEDFGTLAVYAGLLGIISVVSSLRYEMAIPLPEKNQSAASIVVLSILILLAVTLITVLVTWISGDSIASGLGVPKLASFFWLLPLGVFLAGVYKVFNYWAVREKQFPIIARTRILQSVCMIVIQLIAFKSGGVSLIAGHALGQGSGSMMLSRSALSRPEFRKWRWGNIWRLAKRYRNFPMYSTWGALFNNTSTQLPLILFSSMFGATTAGFYMLAHRVLSAPIALVAKSIGNVFFSSAVDELRDGNLSLLVDSIHRKLAQIALPPTLFLVISAPDLFILTFGDDWEMAGEIARWMAPWLYLKLITAPLSLLFSVLEKQKYEALFQCLLLISRMAGLFIGMIFGDLMIAVALYSFFTFVSYSLVLVWEVRASGCSWSAVYSPSINSLPLSVGIVAPLLISLWLDFSQVQWFVATSLSAVFMGVRYVYLARAIW